MADRHKSPVENAREAYDLVKAYAVQETADPLKGLGRYLKFGVPGAVLIGLGLFFLALAGLRGLQQIETFNGGADGAGWFVWAPYAIVFAVAAAILGFLGSRISKGLE